MWYIKYYIKLASKEMCDLQWNIECLSILSLICIKNFVKVVKFVWFDSANSEVISFAGFIFMNVILLDV